ncbi:MAG: hypothetical protein RLZZ242_325 [Bacteroidota bacterium]|jgi:alkaline phosphatase D
MSRATHFIALLGLIFFLGACRQPSNDAARVPLPPRTDQFRLSFGSCNNHRVANHLWDDVLSSEAQAFIWGGDIIYADTDEVQKIEAYYQELKSIPAYAEVVAKMPVSGTWDDHDYGLNDGGEEFEIKAQSKEALMNFFNVPVDDPIRSREGVYQTQWLTHDEYKIAILHLDTRYFRSALTDGPNGRRYQPNPYGEGTMLGEAQWSWLESSISESEADLIIINSSIQLLSSEHPFEKWNNMPHERDRMLALIESSATPVVVLSGDRHISEFSVAPASAARPYPLLDFTSSGMTHAYRDFSGEPNPYRVNEVVSSESFGIVDVDFPNRRLTGYIVGDSLQVLGSIEVEF